MDQPPLNTTEIVQIVSVSLTVLGFIASEILALCPGYKANGLLHWLTLWVSDNRDLQITLPHEPSQTTFELRRRPSIHGDRPRITVSRTPTPAPSRDLDTYSDVTVQNDVPGQDQ